MKIEINTNDDLKDYRSSLTDNQKIMTYSEKIKYSNDILKFTKDFIALFVTTEFKTFKDNHILTKVTRQHLIQFIRELDEGLRLSINDEEIHWNCLLYSKSYYDKYIVNTSIYMIKQLWEETYGEIPEF